MNDFESPIQPVARQRTQRASSKKKTRPSKQPPEINSQTINDPAPFFEEPTELPDYESHEPSKSQSEVTREILSDLRVRVVAALLILGLFSFWGGPPIYRATKVWRANKLMDKCIGVAESGDIPQAVALMRQAIVLAPSDEALFRRVRLFNAGIGEAAPLNSIQTLLFEGKANDDELLVLAEQSIKAGKNSVARACLEKLASNQSARKIIIEMQLLNIDGKQKEAIELARKNIPKAVARDADKFLLATAEMVLKSDVVASQQILTPLAKSKTASGLAALRLLAAQKMTLGKKIPSNGQEIAATLTKHPLHSQDDVLLASDLSIAENPDAKKAIIAALREVRMKASPADALAFARWLNRRFAYNDAIEFIGKERALNDPTWLLVYLDAHAGLGRWGDIFSMLDADTIVGLSDSIRLLFLARAAKKSGDAPHADELWREMQKNLVYENPEVVSFIASYAMQIGENDQAIKAFWTLARRKETALEGFIGLIRFWPKNSPCTELLPVYEEFLEVFPNIPEIRSDYVYLQLLADRNISAASETALGIYKSNPTSLSSLSIAALGLHKEGKIAEANAIYQGKEIAWESAPLPWRAVRAAIFQANGQKNEASQIAATINKSKLRPEEIKLLPTR